MKLVLPFILDQLAVEFSPYKVPIGVFSSSQVLISELSSRIPNCKGKYIVPGKFSKSREPLPVNIVLLATQMDEWWDQVCEPLSDGDMLVTLSYGLLSGLGGSGEKIQMPLADTGRTHQWLYRNGWEIENQIGFWGIRSLIWGWLAYLFTLFGRVDLADRCYFALREYLIVRWKTAKVCWFVMTSSRKVPDWS